MNPTAGWKQARHVEFKMQNVKTSHPQQTVIKNTPTCYDLQRPKLKDTRYL